ncbi:hypothetical protein Gbem_3566 [Citrifermentans bemidjiense Bem]|uniref:Uncharacterized protein n=1 Tax=Citrifermentans bemidjiense (strain ATCC BAA-1014 / DSM 16622 / JCM 12645 / Bem) TaxID=404380 RepID=B5ECU1_CITBB|nr:hypothetical protein [Citrifermentans bemidjiense]ACH40558.1 hypothetical protein Gbem_3566 [Citrifermentans bemidjiense Bem]
MATQSESHPMLPSPFCVGALGAALLSGLTVSGSGMMNTAGVHQLQVSGASQFVYYAGNRVAVIQQQDYEDIGIFANFSLGISKQSADVPGYFFDILHDEFDSLLA